MSGTLTVKELINELLEYRMDEPVYIGLGNSIIPSGGAHISHLTKQIKGISGGIYFIPKEHLEVAP